MSSKEEPTYVFLDTQVFISNRFDFQNAHFRELLGQIRSQQLRVLLPEVTKWEIEYHIECDADEVFAELDRLKRKYPMLKDLASFPLTTIVQPPSRSDVIGELQKRFRRFVKQSEAIEIPLKDVTPVHVFKNYFARKPPFGKDKKKDQFPDAFAAAALILWSLNHGQRKVYAVSGDEDWVATCATNKLLVYKPNLAAVLSLGPDNELASAIKAGIVLKKNELEKRIAQGFEELGFVLEGGEGQVCDVTVSSVDIGQVYVIEASGGTAWADAECSIHFTATIEYAGTGTDDYETEIEDLAKPLVEIRFSYGKEEPSKVEITSVTFPSPDVRIVYPMRDPDPVLRAVSRRRASVSHTHPPPFSPRSVRRRPPPPANHAEA